MRKPDRNTVLLFGLLALIGLMIGLVSLADPLYKMFCGATGLGGTTQISHAAPSVRKERTVKVTFDGNVDPALPWDFKPDVRSVTVKLGEVKTVLYHAHNRGSKTVIGMAVHNVQPDKAGLYFDKIQCFCFTNQALAGGETKAFPVQFYVDPALADDKNADDVTDITLSYTFYLAKDQGKSLAVEAQPLSQEQSNP